MNVHSQAKPTGRLELEVTISLTVDEAKELHESLLTAETKNYPQSVLVRAISNQLQLLQSRIQEKITL